MKICFVTYGLNNKHGYGRASLNIIRGLAKLGIVGPILTLKDSPIPKDLSNKALPILQHNPNLPLINPIKLFKDWIYIKNTSKNCNGIHFLTESFLATTIFGYSKPYIVTTYGTWAIRPLNSHIFSKIIFKRAYQKAKSIISISHFTNNRLSKLVPNANHGVVYLGVNDNKRKSNQKINTIKNKIEILSVGALDPSKGYSISVEAIALLAKKYPNINYKIISGNKNRVYESQLKQIALKYKYFNLEFIYKVSDAKLHGYYEKADIFLLTPIEINGDFEGFGLIFVEAAQHGLPTVTSDSGAIPEIVGELGNGLIVEQGKINKLEDAIEKLINNPDLVKILSKKGIMNANRFSNGQCSLKYKELYYKYFK